MGLELTGMDRLLESLLSLYLSFLLPSFSLKTAAS